MRVGLVNLLIIGALVKATMQECRLMNYMAMHEEVFTSEELTEKVFYYPDRHNSMRIVFSLCKDLDKTTKAMCGIGSEMNLTLIVFEENQCFTYRRQEDLITVNTYYDRDGMKNIDLVYSKDRATNHFFIVNLRKATDSNDTKVSAARNIYSVWFRHSSLISTAVSIPVEKSPYVSTKLNLVSHTYLSGVDYIVSVGIHLTTFYCIALNNQYTTSKLLPRIRPFGIFVCFYAAMRITGWIDCAIMWLQLRSRASLMMNLSYFVMAGLSIYYFEFKFGKAFVNKWIVPLYLLTSLVDYATLLLFLSLSVALVGVAYFLLLAGLPRLTTSLIADQSEWIISFGFSLQFFMQHILWLPFKKIGALKLFYAGLEPYYVNKSFLIFASCMIGGILPVSLLRYKISMYITSRLKPKSDQKDLSRSEIDSQLTDSDN